MLAGEVEEVVAEDDKVAVGWRWSGTHHKVSTTGAGIFRFRGGKIIAATLETDRLGFLRQVGLVPPHAALNAPQRSRP